LKGSEFKAFKDTVCHLFKECGLTGKLGMLIGGWTAYELYNSAMADDNPDLVEATTLGWIPTLFRRCFGNK
jgi:hypothetical protein